MGDGELSRCSESHGGRKMPLCTIDTWLIWVREKERERERERARASQSQPIYYWHIWVRDNTDLISILIFISWVVLFICLCSWNYAECLDKGIHVLNSASLGEVYTFLFVAKWDIEHVSMATRTWLEVLMEVYMWLMSPTPVEQCSWIFTHSSGTLNYVSM